MDTSMIFLIIINHCLWLNQLKWTLLLCSNENHDSKNVYMFHKKHKNLSANKWLKKNLNFIIDALFSITSAAREYNVQIYQSPPRP